MSATQIAGRMAGVDAGAPIRQSSLWPDAGRRYQRNRGAGGVLSQSSVSR